MYIIPIAWLYVALMMSVAEATNSNGTVLGAVITFVLYGLLPIGIILYFMGSPARRRAIHAARAKERLGEGHRALDHGRVRVLRVADPCHASSPSRSLAR